MHNTQEADDARTALQPARRWADNDLTKLGHGPDATDTPAIVVTQFPGEPATVRALYRSPDHHVHELSYTTERSWADNDLTALSGGPETMDTPSIVVTQLPGEPATVRALYRSFDRHVHELSYTTQRGWADNDLTALGHGPAAMHTPSIVVTALPGEPATVRALYRTAGHQVHELSYTTERGWADNDLTALSGGPSTIGVPAIVTTDFPHDPGTVRALYRSSDRHVHELSYTQR
jgi:hypothetical protein